MLVIEGNISDDDPTWHRADESCELPRDSDFPYDVYWVVNHTGEDRTVLIDAAWSFDGYLHLYNTGLPIDPDNLGACREGNDDFQGTPRSQLRVTWPNNVAFAIVASPYLDSGRGSYSITLSLDP